MRKNLLASAAILALTLGLSPAFAEDNAPNPEIDLPDPFPKPSMTGSGLIEQRGNGWDNWSDVTSDGDYNNVNVDQDGGDAGSALVNQVGDRQDAEVIQSDGISGGTGIERNRAEIQQSSSEYADARIEQYHDGSTTDLDSDGTHDNVALISQTDSEYADAEIEQSGSDNDAKIIQTRSDDADSGIYQTGTGNQAENLQTDSDHAFSSIVQSGSLNTAVVWQDDADYSESYVLQDGDSNMVFVEQDFGMHYSTVTQTGNGNMAHVVQ